jgi:hypothetical protein
VALEVEGVCDHDDEVMHNAHTKLGMTRKGRGRGWEQRRCPTLACCSRLPDSRQMTIPSYITHYQRLCRVLDIHNPVFDS